MFGAKQRDHVAERNISRVPGQLPRKNANRGPAATAQPAGAASAGSHHVAARVTAAATAAQVVQVASGAAGTS